MISANELAKISYPTFGFKGKWLNLIGDPAKPFSMMFWAKPGMGKSTMSIELSKYFAQQFHAKVLYVAAEEGLSYTLQNKFDRLHAFDPNIIIVAQLPKDISDYDIIVIDSVSSLKMQPADLINLKHKNPEKSFILVFQSTVNGNYRGSKEFEHEVDVSININENGYAKTMKSRFGGAGSIKVFARSSDPVYKFTQMQEAEKFTGKRKDKLSIVEGDDGKIWVTHPRKAKELKKQGYQIFKL